MLYAPVVKLVRARGSVLVLASSESMAPARLADAAHAVRTENASAQQTANSSTTGHQRRPASWRFGSETSEETSFFMEWMVAPAATLASMQAAHLWHTGMMRRHELAAQCVGVVSAHSVRARVGWRAHGASVRHTARDNEFRSGVWIECMN